MGTSFIKKKEQLVNIISKLNGVCAIGQTGDINEIPRPGESDIDIFVFCDAIPSYEQRKSVYISHDISRDCEMNICEGGHWGTGDIFIVDGVEVMFMYFTIDETWTYLSKVIEGKYLDCENGFYPVGRLATLQNINILYDDKDMLAAIKEKLSIYPRGLARKMIDHHKARIIDQEDFGRVLLRKDILFYHNVFEVSLDHFLQVLYALNETFFPSRKRSERYIATFSHKPEDCYNRIVRVIRLGADKETIEESVNEWYQLVKDLDNLC